MNRRRTTTMCYREEKTWFYLALAIFSLTTSLYIYFVSASVVHVVVRKELDAHIAQTSSFVGSLEAAYIEAQHDVSAEIASLQGYQKTDDKIFIDMTADPVALLQQ